MKRIIAFLTIAMLIVMSSCSQSQDDLKEQSVPDNSSESANQPSKKSQLTIAYQVDPQGLDPQMTAAASTLTVTNNIYDTLVGVTYDWQIVPRIAESWELSEDGMSITFKLRDDIMFHNGRALTSKDVVYSFERLKSDGSAKAADYANIISIEAAGDYAVTFTTEKLDVELIKNFAYPWAAVVPEECSDTLKNNPVGTGPFVLDEWVPQQHIILKRNDDYFGDKAKLETVKYVLVPDATSLMAGLQVGDYDIIPLTGDQVQLLEGDDRFKVLSEPMNAVQVLALNTDNEILKNEKVRQAIASAVNKDDVIEVSQFGHGVKIGSHLPPTAPDYYDTNDIMPYDVEKARNLLAEVGYPDGFELRLSLPKDYQLHVDAGQVIADQLSKIGIKANVEIMEWSTWLNDVYNGKNFDMTVMGHTGRLDSYAFLSRYYSDSNDYISLKTGEVDSLLDSALQELDDAKRKDIYKEIQLILATKLPAVYLQTPDTMLGMSADVEGMHIFPLDIYDMKEVYFK